MIGGFLLSLAFLACDCSVIRGTTVTKAVVVTRYMSPHSLGQGEMTSWKYQIYELMFPLLKLGKLVSAVK